MGKSSDRLIPLNLAVLTVSDRHDASSDSSGDFLRAAAAEAGHIVVDRAIIAEDRYRIRAIVSRWIASEDVQVVVINGGTGLHAKNTTPEAITPLFDREITGFGELFRMFSFEQVAAATLQSRAVAGLANGTLIFAVPGSTSACETAWNRIIAEQIDARTGPCNFVSHLKKR